MKVAARFSSDASVAARAVERKESRLTTRVSRRSKNKEDALGGEERRARPGARSQEKRLGIKRNREKEEERDQGKAAAGISAMVPTSLH